MQIRLESLLALSLLLASTAALSTACSSGGGTTGNADSGGGGSSATGGTAGVGATGGTAGVGATGGSSGATGGAGGMAGAGGTAGAAGSGGTGGGAPMCSSAAECKQADVSLPGSTDPPTPTPTDCIGGQCGLVSSYAGAFKTPKPPKSCTEICAASSYDGQPMTCSASCQVRVVNGFGDKDLFFDSSPDAGPSSVAGLVRYQFSSISGAFEFVEVGCSDTPAPKLIQGSNSYTYVNHSCCCVAP